MSVIVFSKHLQVQYLLRTFKSNLSTTQILLKYCREKLYFYVPSKSLVIKDLSSARVLILSTLPIPGASYVVNKYLNAYHGTEITHILLMSIHYTDITDCGNFAEFIMILSLSIYDH